MRLKIFYLLIYIPVFIFPAFEKNEGGAESHALGNACVALSGSPYALYYNPANIGQTGSFQVAFSYQNFYGISEINKINLITNFHINNTPLSLGINRYGNNLYQELNLAIGSSYKLTSEACIGASIQYYFLQISRYGHQSTVGVNLGFHYSLTDNLNIGVQVTNINQPQLGTIREKLPQCFNLGIAYQPIPSLTILGEFFRDSSFEQDYRAGILYHLSKQFLIRFGTIDKCNTCNIGFGFVLKKIAFDYALLNHQVLGVSHSVSIILDIKNY